MAHITITDDTTNEILKTRFVQLERVVAFDVPGVTVHEGKFPKDEYTYDGIEFTPSGEDKPALAQDEKGRYQLILNQLFEAGVTLPLHRENVVSKQQAKDLIDQAASRACERFVSQGKFTIVEYQLTQQQVIDWRLSGSAEVDAPEMLKAWFDNSDFTTLELAAQNIESLALNFSTVIASTRRLRLEGKKAVADASDFKPVMQSYIDQLDAIV